MHWCCVSPWKCCISVLKLSSAVCPQLAFSWRRQFLSTEVNDASTRPEKHSTAPGTPSGFGTKLVSSSTTASLSSGPKPLNQRELDRRPQRSSGEKRRPAEWGAFGSGSVDVFKSLYSIGCFTPNWTSLSTFWIKSKSRLLSTCFSFEVVVVVVTIIAVFFIFKIHGIKSN